MAIKKKMTETAALGRATATAQAPAKSARGAYQVNLSEDEKALIARGADLSGLELSTFMRSESVKAARRLIGEAGGTT